MSKVTVKLFPPHSELQRKVMMHLANRNTQTKIFWLACGSKWGKSLASAAAMSYALPRIPNSLHRWLAPIVKQTKIGRRYCKQMLPPPPWVKENKAENTLYIPSKDIELQFWHGQNPEDLEGEAVINQFNDECSKLQEQAIVSSRTTWTRTRAQVLNISTPKGRNFFWRGCMRALEEMERAKFENREPKEVFYTAPTSDNPFIPRESIEENKRLLPDRLFRQYFLAEFIDDGEVFSKLIIDPIWKEPYQKVGAIEIWIDPEAKNIPIVAGADWAKSKDYTVVTAWDYSKRPFRCVGFLREQGKRYTEQLIDVAKFLRKFKQCDMLYHDKTGLGNVIDDLLGQIPGLVYHGITFSNASKAEMVNQYITATEQNDILYPNWIPLIKEHEIYEVDTNSLGQMRYNAPEGQHDDIVTSCFLGYAACQEYADKDFEIRFLEDLPKAEFVPNTWENWAYESLDIDPDEGF